MVAEDKLPALEHKRLVAEDPAVLSEIFRCVSDAGGEAYCAMLRKEMQKNVTILHESQRPMESVDEALQTRVAELEREAAATASEEDALRRKIEPDMERRVSEAFSVDFPVDEDQPDVVHPPLPESLMEYAKQLDLRATHGRIEKSLKQAEATETFATRAAQAAKLWNEKCHTPSADVSVTINVDAARSNLSEGANGTSASSSTPRGAVDGFISPETSRAARSNGDNLRLPTMSPLVTPRTRARRKLLARGRRNTGFN